VKQVGRELGVRYVLEGSVRKAANRVRITCQLIEAATGRHLWAERYDRALDDIFALQDEITLAVVGAIEPSLRHAEFERVKRKRPDRLDAYDLYLQALATSLSRTAEDHTKALALLERVLALEPGYIGAHALMADCLRGRFVRGGGRTEDREAALQHAHAELALACDDATSLAMVGFVIHQLGRDAVAAREIFDRALQLSPSSNLALSWSAVVLIWMGELDLAIERAERARRLSPIGQLIVNPNVALAEAHFLAGRYTEAAEAARRAVDANPRFSLSWAVLAAAFVRLGRMEDAKAAAQRVLSIEPDFRFEKLAQLVNLEDVFAPFIAAVREAGLPL
jgi:adenylate cyclase